jgi:hypothetical protein
MTYLVTAELVPDALERCTREETAWGVMVGLLVITSGLGL